jgi:hypothetical protein
MTNILVPSPGRLERILKLDRLMLRGLAGARDVALLAARLIGIDTALDVLYAFMQEFR